MKVLFFDIEGTLVSFKTHRIPDSAVKALERASQNGHKIIIATGRHHSIIDNIVPLQERGLIDGYVTLNGAYCFVGDEVLFSSQMNPESVRLVAQKAEEWCVPCIFVGDDYRVAGANELFTEIFERQCNVPKALVPDTDYHSPLKKEIFQLTPFFDNAQEAELRPLLPDCEIERWHPAFADITAAGNTKAHGIDIICEHFGLTAADAIAFGDGGNDVPMLRHAGIGVAMGNGTDEAKQAADFVTATVEEDGIANALAHFNLI